MAQFNAFEEALDFSFWKEICEEHGTLRRFRRGKYFVRVGEVMRKSDGLSAEASSIP